MEPISIYSLWVRFAVVPTAFKAVSHFGRRLRGPGKKKRPRSCDESDDTIVGPQSLAVRVYAIESSTQLCNTV